MDEAWRPVPGYPDYEVSDHGRVRSLKLGRERFLGPNVTTKGYHRVCLMRHGVGDFLRVHRLVLAAFVGPCPPGLETRHLDGDPGNNRLENLRYGTRLENAQDAREHGHHPAGWTDTACARGHALNEQTIYVRPNGERRCRECNRLSWRRKPQPQDAA